MRVPFCVLLDRHRQLAQLRGVPSRHVECGGIELLHLRRQLLLGRVRRKYYVLRLPRRVNIIHGRDVVHLQQQHLRNRRGQHARMPGLPRRHYELCGRNDVLVPGQHVHDRKRRHASVPGLPREQQLDCRGQRHGLVRVQSRLLCVRRGRVARVLELPGRLQLGAREHCLRQALYGRQPHCTPRWQWHGAAG